MRRWIKILGLSFLALMVISCIGPDLLLLPFTLLFGWINALRRVVSALVASSSALVWAGLAIVLVVAGTHWFGLWLWRRLWPDGATGDGCHAASKWRWRWTLTFHAALGIVLFSAMGVVGVAHQTGWLIASREPIYANRLRHSGDLAAMHSLSGAIQATGVEQNWDTAAIRKLVWGCFYRGENDMQERLHIIYLEDANYRLARALIFPRNPKAFAKTGVAIVEPEKPFRTAPADSLTKLLQLRPTAAQTAAATTP